jgi:hypothetical protein
MEKDVAGLLGMKHLAPDNVVVVCYAFLQQVIMRGEMAVHEAYRAPIYTQSNGHRSLVSLKIETVHITTISSHIDRIYVLPRNFMIYTIQISVL